MNQINGRSIRHTKHINHDNDDEGIDAVQITLELRSSIPVALSYLECVTKGPKRTNTVQASVRSHVKKGILFILLEYNIFLRSGKSTHKINEDDLQIAKVS